MSIAPRGIGRTLTLSLALLTPPDAIQPSHASPRRLFALTMGGLKPSLPPELAGTLPTALLGPSCSQSRSHSITEAEIHLSQPRNLFKETEPPRQGTVRYGSLLNKVLTN